MPSRAPFLKLLEAASRLPQLYELAVLFDLDDPLRRPLRLLWERGYIDEGAAAALRAAMPGAGDWTVESLLGSPVSHQELWSRVTPEVQKHIIAGVKRLLANMGAASSPERSGDARASPAKAEARDEIPRGEIELLEWAQEAGVPEALDAPAAEVLEPGRWTARQHESLGEVLVVEGPSTVWPWKRTWSSSPSRPDPAKVHAARAYLFSQREEARRAVLEEAAVRPDAGAPPEWERLLAAVASFRQNARRGTLPTTAEMRNRGDLRFHPVPPRFVYRDPRPMLRHRPPFVAEVTIDVDAIATGQLTVTCDPCGPAKLQVCRHALAAIDRLADWTRQAQDETGAAIARKIAAPAWERTLEMLRNLRVPYASGGDASAGRLPAGGRLAWRVELSPGSLGARVQAVAQKPLKRGGWSHGTAVRLEAVLRGAVASSAADRLAAAVIGTPSSHGGSGDRAWFALSALVGAGNVALASAPGQPLRVEVTEIELCCKPRDGGFTLAPVIDGQLLPVDLWRKEEFPMFVVRHDPGKRRLLLGQAPERMAAMMRVLEERGWDFPAEAADLLAEELSSLPVPVSLPPELLGRECTPDGRVLVAAGFSGLSLSLEALVRPLPQGVTFPAGTGPALVRASRDGERLFARRDQEEERRMAEALWVSLGFAGTEGRVRASVEVSGTEALAGLRRLEEAEKAGLEVLWPPERPTFTRRFAVADLRVKVHGAHFWFGISGEAEVDGERLALAAILDAARRRERFVKLSENRWAELEEELLRKVTPLADLAVEGERGPEVTVAAAPVLEALAAEVRELEPVPEFGELLRRLRASHEVAAEVPGALRAELRPYQREGFQWLARLSAWAPGACLADDMGLGKTVQALALLLHREPEGPALVVAPTSVCFNWEVEARKFAPSLRVVSWHRCDRAAALERLTAGDVLVVSYGLLARDVKVLKAVRFGTVVLDEAQNVKSAEAQRSRATRELEAGFFLALTGTPLENHLGELWSLFRVVFPGLLGARAQFRERFQLPIERERDATRRKALAAVLRPFLLRRAKREVAAELPARTEVVVPVALSGEERRLYEEARLAAVAELSRKQEGQESEGAEGPELAGPKDRRFRVLAALTELRLLACHPRLYDPKWAGPASKLGRFLELVDELLDEGHRALVFSQFTRHLALVREALDARGVEYRYLDGGTPEGERRGLVEAFQRGEGALFLISLKAGGSGLNLTAADHVIHLDPWWNPAVEDQATDRAHRIGQTKPVTVFRLVARGTIEEQILSLHGEKRALLAGVLEGTGAAAAMDVEELMSLLARGSEGEEDA